MPATRAPTLGRNLTPRIKVWLAWEDGFLMGPNYLRFLEGVAEKGTIREAGAKAGWSYRTCLNRIRRMEKVLGEPVLLTTRGGLSHGGARLSPAAIELVRIFGQWRAAMHRLSDQAFRQVIRRKPRRAGPSKRMRA
jgi:molybdate transport system regulatory protein